MKNCLFILLMLLSLPVTLLAEDSPVLVEAPSNRQLKLIVAAPRSLDTAPAAEMAKEMSSVIAFDLNMSGHATAETREQMPMAGSIAMAEADFAPWLNSGSDLLVKSEYSIKGDNLTVEFRLYDLLNRKALTARRYLGKTAELRHFAHSFADEVLHVLTGEKGCFTTQIAFVTAQSGNKEIAIMDWDGYNQLPITRNGSINLNPDFSPDGRMLIFSSYKRGNPDLFKRVLSRSDEIPLSQRSGLNITGVWSPDGSKIALTLSKDGNSEIYTIAKDGSKPERLTANPAIEIYPTWSPDGKQIAFVSDRLGKPQVFIMNADGSSVRRLTTAGSYNVNPRWSPKGDKIAYVRMQSGGFQIYAINTDGSGDTQLTSSGSNENPAWSPDGRFITFGSKRGGPEAIYVMRADGSGQTRVSRGAGGRSQPAWAKR
ncbi:MAG TPA: Tol-Pal system beta propeller repeat protein TolB [Desulfuromonadaceae bacterium]|jgi:TolB protein